MLAETLKKLRTERNLGQVQLAKLTGISKTSIGSWEVGFRKDITVPQAVKLCKFFNIGPKELMGGNRI